MSVQLLRAASQILFPAFTDEIRLHTSSANGSTGIRVKVYSTVVVNVGSAMTYVPSAVDGDSVLINATGYYHISLTSAMSVAPDIFGITKNVPATTNIMAAVMADVLAKCGSSNTVVPGSCSWAGKLTAGDVIRSHQDGATVSSTAILAHFSLLRIG